MAAGLTSQQIAGQQGITLAAVKADMKQLFAALGAQSRTHAVALGYREGYLDQTPLPGDGSPVVLTRLPVERVQFGSSLPSREIYTLAGLARGQTNAQIAQALGVDRSQVAKSISNAMCRLGQKNRFGLVAAAYRSGVLAKLQPEPRPPIRIFRRQLEVLQGMAEGLDNSEIGLRFDINPSSVVTRATKLYRALGVRRRTHAVAIGYQQGLLLLPNDQPIHQLVG
jgi:DNA-binding NarL/FixJ family response regulator